MSRQSRACSYHPLATAFHCTVPLTPTWAKHHLLTPIWAGLLRLRPQLGPNIILTPNWPNLHLTPTLARLGRSVNQTNSQIPLWPQLFSQARRPLLEMSKPCLPKTIEGTYVETPACL
ncbi:hypothetical protein AVEN_169799-1 [Araneus ventricosus]|uniref:Uncharacterized protein n=1 Tax=Araneus ventricosus TaxID=182803 RepID=A0A4Y2LRJ8_ARAVE|nr:hypothetical protein AVEN_169799-1 [Araneus ventricosus]